MPKGMISVGGGLVVSGVCGYGFLAIAARALGPVCDAPLATYWALLFVAGPGFFIPLEQEVGRAVSARRARGLGGRPVIVRACVGGGIFSLALGSLVIGASGSLAARVFAGEGALVVALAVGLIVSSAQFLARGTLSGNGAFCRYGFSWQPKA